MNYPISPCGSSISRPIAMTAAGRPGSAGSETPTKQARIGSAKLVVMVRSVLDLVVHSVRRDIKTVWPDQDTVVNADFADGAILVQRSEHSGTKGFSDTQGTTQSIGKPNS